jgi:hypothetical protein
MEGILAIIRKIYRNEQIYISCILRVKMQRHHEIAVNISIVTGNNRSGIRAQEC